MEHSKKSKILVIDDDQDMVNLIESRLLSEGFDVKTATDGEEGLLLLESYSPNVLVLDIKMPKMDGYTLVRKMHRNENLVKIPVIIMTGYDAMADIFKMEGICDYLVKPFSPEDLIKRIRIYLSNANK